MAFGTHIRFLLVLWISGCEELCWLCDAMFRIWQLRLRRTDLRRGVSHRVFFYWFLICDQIGIFENEISFLSFMSVIFSHMVWLFWFKIKKRKEKEKVTRMFLHSVLIPAGLIASYCLNRAFLFWPSNEKKISTVKTFTRRDFSISQQESRTIRIAEVPGVSSRVRALRGCVVSYKTHLHVQNSPE